MHTHNNIIYVCVCVSCRHMHTCTPQPPTTSQTFWSDNGACALDMRALLAQNLAAAVSQCGGCLAAMEGVEAGGQAKCVQHERTFGNLVNKWLDAVDN